MDTASPPEEVDPQTRAEAVREEPELQHHPEPRDYVKVAVVLAMATAIEVAWYYLDIPEALFIGALLVLAVFKFAVVVMWFMHLRFDRPIFRRLFVAGLDLAIVVYLIVLVLFGVLKWSVLVVTVMLIVAAPFVAILFRGRLRAPRRVRSVGS